MKTTLASHIAPTSQEYALVYCQYDALKGNRDWKQLLKDGEVKAIDLEIARKVMLAGKKHHLSRGSAVTRAISIIYYGSPYSQGLKTEVERIAYAEEILREILEGV